MSNKRRKQQYKKLNVLLTLLGGVPCSSKHQGPGRLMAVALERYTNGGVGEFMADHGGLAGVQQTVLLAELRWPIELDGGRLEFNGRQVRFVAHHNAVQARRPLPRS